MLSRLRRLISSPGFILYLLAPAIGELLSSSSPPKEYFTVFGFTCMHILYGGGALIVRELTHRWGKGWATLLVLGAAYGVLEEGLLCKSFFDPNWPDLGVLATYGRWLGVSWIWALELTVYHACVSIATSILIVELIFPHRRHESWASLRILKILGVLLALDTLLGLLFFGGIRKQPYYPPFLPYLLTVVLVITLTFCAKSLPFRILPEIARTVPRPRWFWLIGFLSMIAFFAVPATLVSWHTPAVVTFYIVAAMFGGVVWLVLRLSGNGAAWNDQHRLALAAGPLSVFTLAGFIREINKAEQPDDPTGMIVVATVAAILLLWLSRRVASQVKQDSSGNVSPILTSC